MHRGITTAHSVVEPGPRMRAAAGSLVVLYALITIAHGASRTDPIISNEDAGTPLSHATT